MNADLPSRLRNLIEELNEVHDIDGAYLSFLLSHSGISAADVDSFASFNHPAPESYGRKLLYENDRFKILLMSWNPGDFTAIHNHGTSEWGSILLFGATTHRLYQFDDQTLRLSEADTYPPGHVATVFGDLIHMMGNSTTTRFATLHIYGANSKKLDDQQNAQVYFPELNKVLETNGEAFLNLKKELILSEREFNGFDPDAMMDYLNLIKPFYIKNNQIGILDRLIQNHHISACI